jgi:hypothetical protein
MLVVPFVDADPENQFANDASPRDGAATLECGTGFQPENRETCPIAKRQGGPAIEWTNGQCARLSAVLRASRSAGALGNRSGTLRET